MSNILITIILLLFWSIGYFIYDFGALIHVFLGLALITVGLRIIQGRKMKIKLRGKYY
ncbi:MAG TPA: lmo0937 family membrane protein [Cyclobacteriaceae bacterium]|nr:lmo0937 family membrane protein [Cyclobacteriaceae bacterium]